VTLSYRIVADSALESHPDACEVPALSDPNEAVPIRLYDSAYPIEMVE
jgi:hypothetical protein